MALPATANGGQSVSELDKTKPLEIQKTSKSYLFYGPPGTGKTTFALAHPGKRKLLLDADDKAHEMENLTPGQLTGVTVWQPKELLTPRGISFIEVDPTRKDPKRGFVSGESPKGYQRQVDVTNELLGLASKGEFPYDVVIWDSGSQTVEHLIRAILHRHSYGSMNETLWGVFGSNFNEYLQGFLRLPCDRIVIFHDRHVTKRDREGHITEEYTRPSVYGQAGLQIARFFSEVYYFLGSRAVQNGSKVERVYEIQTCADAILPARTTKGLDFKQVLDPKRIYG